MSPVTSDLAKTTLNRNSNWQGRWGPTFNTMFLGRPKVSTSNGTVIHSAIFAGQRYVTDWRNTPQQHRSQRRSFIRHHFRHRVIWCLSNVYVYAMHISESIRLCSIISRCVASARKDLPSWDSKKRFWAQTWIPQSPSFATLFDRHAHRICLCPLTSC